MAAAMWLASALAACMSMSAAEFLGATPGGAQDIGLARSIIAEGGVPRLDQFTVEGLFSEHDLTLANPPPCEQALCLGSAAGLEVGLDDDQRDLFVQIGMSSNIRADAFVREPLNLAIVVDTSGSMSSVLPLLREALHALVDALRPDDRVALVVFESIARTIQPSTPATDAQALHDAVDRLHTGGSTNMEAGMRLGYAEIDEFVDEDHLSRLMVFTDAMTNTGNTDVGSFNALTQAAAARDIGFTFFGFGDNFNADFVDQIAALRGGNYRFVRPEDVKPIFAEELDFLVTPIAYDLRVALTAGAGVERRAVYGVPQVDSHVDGELFDVTTVFLSKRQGGIVLRFDGRDIEALRDGESIKVGEAIITYQTIDGTPVEQRLAVSMPLAAPISPTASHYPDAPIQRTLAVTDQYLAMKRVCGDYWNEGGTSHDPDFDVADAAARLDAASAKLQAAHALLEDANLQREVELLARLKQNIGAAE
ncbi:MAG: VWA domain-containing protein [Deltaproteobacteria bacterium]|nr:VWA domain-containing protein [Deltaproteobacteria bacterium]